MADMKSIDSQLLLMRALIDIIPDRVFAKDVAGRFLFGNMAAARTMGAATPEDLIGKSDFDFYPHDLAAQYCAAEQQLFASGDALLGCEEPVVYSLTREQG